MDRGDYIRTGMSLTEKEADAYCCMLDSAQKRYGFSRCDAMEWLFATGLKCAYDMEPERESSRQKAREIGQRIEELESGNLMIDEKKTGGFLYFIRAKDNLFKIGITRKSPMRRLSAIQTACPYEIKLHVALYYEDCHRKEHEFHEILTQYRLRGEWFEVDISVLDELIVQEFVNSCTQDTDSLMDTTMPLYIVEEANRRLVKTGGELFHGGWPWDENIPQRQDQAQPAHPCPDIDIGTDVERAQ